MEPKTEKTLRKLIAILPEHLRSGWRFDASNIGGPGCAYGLISDEPHTSLGINITYRYDFRQDRFWHEEQMMDGGKLSNVLAAYVAAANPANVQALIGERDEILAELKRTAKWLETCLITPGTGERLMKDWRGPHEHLAAMKAVIAKHTDEQPKESTHE